MFGHRSFPTRMLAALAGVALCLAPGVAGAIDVEDATTIDEIVAADDYTFGDADAIRLYRAFLNREPDLVGAKYWIETARSGADPDDLAYGFGQSAEFRNRYGTLDDRAFLTVLYDNMLGRAPDAAGLEYWLGEMGPGGLSQDSVVRWIVFNDEFIDRFPYIPPASGGRDWFPRIEATETGDLVGAPIGSAADDAEAFLRRALGEPTTTTDWEEGCPLGGLYHQRTLRWGALGVSFERFPGEDAELARWWFTKSEVSSGVRGPATVFLENDLQIGDSLSAIAFPRTDSVQYLEVFDLYALMESPQVIGYESATGPSEQVFVPAAVFCD